MNFLAHFQLSPAEPDPIAGAFLGDFVRGNVDALTDLPTGIRHGITLHRRIDAFTDAHPIWQRSAARLAPERRRLAGIIVDVIYDHFLCRNWERFSAQPLEEFADFCYTSLLARAQFMSLEARQMARRMREHHWLESYRKMEGIGRAFHGLEQRSEALSGIQHANLDFEANFDPLERDFLDFYPILRDFATREWAELVTAPGGADS